MNGYHFSIGYYYTFCLSHPHPHTIIIFAYTRNKCSMDSVGFIIKSFAAIFSDISWSMLCQYLFSIHFTWELDGDVVRHVVSIRITFHSNQLKRKREKMPFRIENLINRTLDVDTEIALVIRMDCILSLLLPSACYLNLLCAQKRNEQIFSIIRIWISNTMNDGLFSVHGKSKYIVLIWDWNHSSLLFPCS